MKRTQHVGAIVILIGMATLAAAAFFLSLPVGMGVAGVLLIAAGFIICAGENK